MKQSKISYLEMKSRFLHQEGDSNLQRKNVVVLLRIILWLGWTFRPLSTPRVLLHNSSFSGFQHSECWPTWVGSFHHPSLSTVVFIDNILTQAISSTPLPSRFSFFSTYLEAKLNYLLILELPQYTLLRVRIDTSQR